MSDTNGSGLRLAILPSDTHLAGDGFSVEDAGGARRVGPQYCRGLSCRGLSQATPGSILEAQGTR